MTVDLSTGSRDSSRPSELRQERANAASSTSDGQKKFARSRTEW